MVEEKILFILAKNDYGCTKNVFRTLYIKDEGFYFITGGFN